MSTVGRAHLSALTGALALLVLTSCATTPAAEPTQPAVPRFKTALNYCNLSGASGGVEYGGTGDTLVLRTESDDINSTMDWATVQCVLKYLDATDATLNVIAETRAIDGRQDKSWDGIDASWTYHPDAGLNLTLEDTEW